MSYYGKDVFSLDQLIVEKNDGGVAKTFGKGMVVSAKAMGGDMLLEIAFDTCGTKKVMAKMAKLTKF